MPIKAAIFDMDGVLLDSMRYHVKAWQKTFRPLGLRIPSYGVYAREGEDWRKSTRDFLIMARRRPDAYMVDKIFKKRSAIFKKIFRPKVFPEAQGLLKLVKAKGVNLALVTATPRCDVKKMLPASMADLFGVMVCGGEVKKGKPHPEPYLAALKKLGIKAADALVVENAPYGIKSAKLAGLKCVAVATSLPRRYLKGADMVFGSLKGLKSYFEGRKIYGNTA
jgi:beta-phosphoglucomutase